MKLRGWQVILACALLGGGLPGGARAELDERLKVGMVSDGGPFNDKGFNQNSREGLERALQEFSIYAYFRESRGEGNYRNKLRELAEKDYKLIIGVGYRMQEALAETAKQYPETWFAIVDGNYQEIPDNVRDLTFQVDQCAFPAGYLAAAWADLQDPTDPQVGFVGGIQTEPVDHFVLPFKAGVEYYNQRKGKAVKFSGGYVGSFEDHDGGFRMGAELIDQGVEVLFGVGSISGNGAISAAKERGKWAIGVDVDQYYTLIEEQDCLLTSCLKRMDNAVFEVLKAAVENKFEGGAKYEGTLRNQGVGLAPFHHFEQRILQSVKDELTAIQDDIAAGTLATGWPAP